MREEISEPQQWRSSRYRNIETRASWVERCNTPSQTAMAISALPKEIVDAAFAEDSIAMEPVRGSRRDLASQGTVAQTAKAVPAKSAESTDLLHDISTQLAMLQTQQEHLQRLLNQVER